jgi:hypothetical protein
MCCHSLGIRRKEQMVKNLLVTAFVVFSLVMPLSSPAKNIVMSEGTAFIHNDRMDIARDKAIESALRQVVEKTVGVMISSTTEVENFEVKLDQILSESQGFINTYKVVDEKREGDILKVTVEADVGVGKLKDRMKAIQMVITRKSMPRVMVIFGNETQADMIAESVMSQYFMSKGFTVIDAETVKKNVKHERLQAMASDEKELKKLGHRYGAEIVILGSIEFSHKSMKVDNIEMVFNKALGSVKAVNVDTGVVIATDSDTRSAPGMGEAEKRIIEEMGRKMSENVMNQVMERWSSELTNAVTVTVVASGLKSYQELAMFKEAVAREVRGVKNMYQRSYANGRVELDINIKGNTQSLADDIVTVKLKNRRVKILEMTQNKVIVRLEP